MSAIVLPAPNWPDRHRPMVSIIIPSKTPNPDREPLLAHALASVFAQTFPDFEYIVKGCSQYWGHKINDAVAASCGKYVLILCDDDKLHPDFLKFTVEKAEQGYDVVSTDVQAFGDVNESITLPPWTRETFMETTPAWITTLISRDKWNEVKGMDPRQYFQDYDLMYRLYQINVKHARIHKHLFNYRVHGDAGSRWMPQDLAHAMIRAKHPELSA